MNKAIFLDRDGVLIEDVGYLSDLNQIHYLDKSVEGLRLLQELGYSLIVVTNQSGVARGYFKERFVKKTHEQIKAYFLSHGIEILHFYYCPHYENGQIKKYAIVCDCRKPKIGLLRKAEEDYGVCLSKSIMIGDKASDMQLAHNAGMLGIRIASGEIDSGEQYRCENLLEAAEFVKTNSWKKK